MGHVIQLVTGTGQVDLTEPWFVARSEVMVQLLEFVVVPLLLVATIGPVLRQDLRRLARVWGVGLPVAVLVGAVRRPVHPAGDRRHGRTVPGHRRQPQSHPGREPSGAVHRHGHARCPAAGGGRDQPVLLIVGSVLLWLELVVRAAAIYVAVFFMPLALACYVWPATTAVAKRTVELLAALILSKFVIVATLTLGVAALHGGPSADNAVIGSAILLIAGFAPFCPAHGSRRSSRPEPSPTSKDWPADRGVLRAEPPPRWRPDRLTRSSGLVLSARSGAAPSAAARRSLPQPIGTRRADYPSRTTGRWQRWMTAHRRYTFHPLGAARRPAGSAGRAGCHPRWPGWREPSLTSASPRPVRVRPGPGSGRAGRGSCCGAVSVGGASSRLLGTGGRSLVPVVAVADVRWRRAPRQLLAASQWSLAKTTPRVPS